MESGWLRFQSIAFLAKALLSHPETDVEHKGQIRVTLTDSQAVKLPDGFQVKSPTVSLVGGGAVVKAVAQHDTTGFQVGYYFLSGDFGSGRFVKKKFSDV
jgi:hypothetical protein